VTKKPHFAIRVILVATINKRGATMGLQSKRQDNLEREFEGFVFPDLNDSKKDDFLGKKTADPLKSTEEK